MSAAEENRPGDGGDDEPRSIHGVFRRAIEAADGPTVSVGAILRAFGARAYGPLLFILGVLMVSPVGAIPGAPVICVVLVTLLMGQSILRRGPPWIPGRLARIEIDSARLRHGLERTLPWFRWLERVVKPRLTGLIRPPLSHLWAVACILIALTMLPLGFVPFAAAIPALALAIIGLGLMSADGVLVLAGVGVSAAAFWIGLSTVSAAV